MRYVIVKKPKEDWTVMPFSTVEVPFDWMYERISCDCIERALLVPLPSRRWNRLEFWCDENGLAKELELNFFRPTDEAPIVGTVVVTMEEKTCPLCKGAGCEDCYGSGEDPYAASLDIQALAFVSFFIGRNLLGAYTNCLNTDALIEKRK